MPTGYKELGDKQGGDPHIMRLKDINKVRPLDNQVAGWRQHGIEHPSDPEQFASMVCPGPRSCPLDRKPVDATGKQRFPISRRFAANVWDYDTNEVKVLVAGPQVFDEFKGAATVGIDPSTCDWTITKTGQGLNTKYEVIRHDSAPFSAAQVTPDMLHEVAKYEEPASPEAIFETLEKFGVDYDALSVPSYTYEQALAFTMPYGKHKGETIEQLLVTEQSYLEYIHGAKLEQGTLGDPVFLALQTAMQERGLVLPLEEALEAMPDLPAEPQERQVTAPQAAAAPATQATASPVADASSSTANMEPLVGPDGQEVMVPLSAVESMLTAGFTRPAPLEPATAVDANAPMEVLVNGTKVTLPREQALLLIEAGTAERVESEPEATPAPKLPLPDEVVQVDVAGTVVPMPYVQAAAVVDNPASSAKFVDEGVATAHERSNATAAATEDPSGTPATASASTPADPDKPFVCDQCGAGFKAQGGLTQHKNRVHKAEEPQPSAIPAQTNGGAGDDVMERVKDKIAHAPFAKDFQMLLKIFEEETGKKNFAQMTPDEVAKLEVRIDAEIEAAPAAK